MYDKALGGIGTTAAAGTLAYTGAAVVWYFLAAFALVAAGMALLRAFPKAQA